MVAPLSLALRTVAELMCSSIYLFDAIFVNEKLFNDFFTGSGFHMYI